jgi:beta-phosphoglucomutase
MKISAFLFDLDGVLTDTSEFHYQGWKRLADEEGLLFTRQDNEALRGVSRRESLNLLLKDTQIDEETAHAWMDRKNRYYLEMVEKMTSADLLPGALDLLRELRAARIKTVVASASKNAGLVIERLNLAREIDAVMDARLVAQSKPSPDIFLKAAELAGVTPRQCVVVEDAAAGIEAGKAAGMLTLGIGPQERLEKADVILPNLENIDLVDLLGKLTAAFRPAPVTRF